MVSAFLKFSSTGRGPNIGTISLPVFPMWQIHVTKERSPGEDSGARAWLLVGVRHSLPDRPSLRSLQNPDFTIYLNKHRWRYTVILFRISKIRRKSPFIKKSGAVSIMKYIGYYKFIFLNIMGKYRLM